jgi:hypothetical protein
MHRITSAVLLTSSTLALVALFPGQADAQRRRPGPRVVRAPVVVNYGYPRRYYDPWYQWGPYGHPYPPYGYGYRDELTTSVRLEVDQRDADVYVDGYRAGVVDDFDGVFQRLRLRPGGHEITIYRDGYRTISESIYLSSGTDRKIRLTMERLREGERSEDPPAPTEVRNEGDRPAPDAPGRRRSRRPGAPVPQSSAAPDAPAEAPARFGSLSIRVQPADAEIFIDGERWDAPAAGTRFSIELSEGRHRIEVRKAGFTSYAEDVLIRRGATLTLNVLLT